MKNFLILCSLMSICTPDCVADVFADHIINAYARSEYNKLDDDQKKMVRSRVAVVAAEQCHNATRDYTLSEDDQDSNCYHAKNVWASLCQNLMGGESARARRNYIMWQESSALQEAFSICALSAIQEVQTKTKLGAASSYVDDEDVKRYKIKHAPK